MKRFLIILLLLFFLLPIQKIQAKELKFVQITDMNFTLDIDDIASEERAKYLKQAINDINKDKSIKFVVFTGNSVRHPDRKELVAFFKLANRLNKPYYVVIGNKEVLRYKHFTKKNFMHTAWLHNANMRFKKPSYVFVPNKDIAFIVLDGVNEMMPVPSGNYRQETLEWLDKQLEKHENKKVVLLQHFPVISPSDKPVYDVDDLNKYMQTINSYDNVLAVISGHFNADATTYAKGVYHISSPAFTAPYFKYKVIELKYEPKYLFSSPSEFVINQKTHSMVETNEIEEKTEKDDEYTNIKNVNNANTSQENTLQEQE